MEKTLLGLTLAAALGAGAPPKVDYTQRAQRRLIERGSTSP